MEKKIIIRADGNARIGVGHIMRCMTIVTACSDTRDILFVCADEMSARVVRDKGLDVYVLHSDYRKLSDELRFWEGIRNSFTLSSNGLSILVDSYFINNSYLKALQKIGRVIVLDDMCNKQINADAIINYNAYATRDDYRNLGINTKCHVYAGCNYLPIRKEFLNKTYIVRKQIQSILITTGGGDVDNIAGKILTSLYTPDYEFVVVSGQYNIHFQYLQEFAKCHEGVRIVSNVEKMSQLMMSADIAITAGGTTIYELCAIGVPFICFAYAENQEKLINYIKEYKIALSSGHYHKDADFTLRKINENFGALSGSFSLRSTLSEREKCLHDGKGASRIMDILKTS